jgi:hypothetical protein
MSAFGGKADVITGKADIGIVVADTKGQLVLFFADLIGTQLPHITRSCVSAASR